MITLHGHTPKLVASAIVVLIAVSLSTAAQPATDNAALLYYQACLLYAQPDETMGQMLNEFRDGKMASNEAIRKHVEANRRAIDLVMKAGDLARCDWGYDYSEGIAMTMTHLAAVKHITFLVAADARLLGEQGDYRAALDRCLAIHKMARHVADRVVITYLMGLSQSNIANRTIQDLLIDASGDAKTLDQLKTRLIQIQDAFPPLQYAMTQEGEVLAASMSKEKASEIVKECALDENDPKTGFAAARILAGDKAFFEKNRTHWLNTIAGLVAVLDSRLPYPQTHAKLDEYTTQMTTNAKQNPDATFTGILLPATSRVYLLKTRLQAQSNALRTAIGLYAIRARTGQLPGVLPADALVDPFSGKPFAYEVAADHFTLRCQEKEEATKAEANQYEFRIEQ